MGSRSRRKARPGAARRPAPTAAGRTDTAAAAAPPPPAVAPEPAATAPPAERPLTRAEKIEAKNQAVRDELEPLAPGERPEWVTVSSIIATLLGAANLILYIVGVRTKSATFAATVGPSVILIVAGAGMWRARYWAVLGFQVILGITCVFSSLAILFARSLTGVAIAGPVAIGSGFLFYKLVRSMARIQMPRPPEPRRPL